MTYLDEVLREHGAEGVAELVWGPGSVRAAVPGTWPLPPGSRYFLVEIGGAVTLWLRPWMAADERRAAIEHALASYLGTELPHDVRPPSSDPSAAQAP